jgi:CRP/FNR family transcriptional regulator
LVHTTGECDLERAEFFRALAADELRRVLPLLHEKRFDARSVLFFQGQPAQYLWVVRSGEVRLYKSSQDGRITTLETLGPGQSFGAVSAIDEETYPASAEAVIAGSAWCLPREALLRLLEDHSAVAVEFLRIVAGRLREAQERIRSFAHDPAPARLARALVEAAQGEDARVTRRALAEAAGTTVETAIRVLRRFDREGWISSEVGHVHLLDEPALRRLSGGLED